MTTTTILLQLAMIGMAATVGTIVLHAHSSFPPHPSRNPGHSDASVWLVRRISLHRGCGRLLYRQPGSLARIGKQRTRISLCSRQNRSGHRHSRHLRLYAREPLSHRPRHGRWHRVWHCSRWSRFFHGSHHSYPASKNWYLTRDRMTIELKLEALEQAGDWPAASDLITKRLHRRTSRVWRDALHARLYSDLVQAGSPHQETRPRHTFRKHLS